MWNVNNQKKYQQKTLRISKEMLDALEKHSSKFNYTIQRTIKKALDVFFSTTYNEKESLSNMYKRTILAKISIPGSYSEKEIRYYIKKHEPEFIKKLNKLEKNGICSSTTDGIRRILTWYLKKEGFL